MSREKETGKNETTEKGAGRKYQKQPDANWISYSESMIDGALCTDKVFIGDSILRKTYKTLICLSSGGFDRT